MSNFGPFNRFGLWVARTWGNLEHRSAEFGKNYTLVSLFSRLSVLKSPSLLKSLSKHLDRKTSADSATRLTLTDNSLLLFYSKNVGNHLPKIRRWELIVPPVVLLFTQTWLPTFVFLSGAFLYQPLASSAGKLFVVRMDLLPHMEAVVFHKVGMFGRSVVDIVPIKNLVKIKPENSEHDYYFRLLGGADMIFKDTASGAEFAFETQGTWIDENLKHSLIV